MIIEKCSSMYLNCLVLKNETDDINCDINFRHMVCM